MATATEEACSALRNLIKSGDLRQGERLSELKAANLLGMTVAPVRQSLRILEMEGLVSHRGDRRSRVVGYSEDDDPQTIIRRYELRECIESYAAGLAALYMNGIQIERLRKLVAEIAGHFDSGNYEARCEAAKELHLFLLGNCGNPLLLEVWQRERLSPIAQRTRELDAAFHSRLPTGCHGAESLLEMVEAIAAHDRAKAEQAARHHQGAVTKALREMIWKDGGENK